MGGHRGKQGRDNGKSPEILYVPRAKVSKIVGVKGKIAFAAPGSLLKPHPARITLEEEEGSWLKTPCAA
jgi:hypothetical protein